MNYRLFTASLFASLLTLHSANAETFDYLPYAGIDYSYNILSASGLDLHYNVAGINIGTKYNDYFGTELFYQQSDNYHKETNFGAISNKFKTSYRAYGLDLNAYLPLGCFQTFELFATAGIGEYVFREKFKSTVHVDGITRSYGTSYHESAIGYRWGGGLIYNLSDNFSLRASVRYINLDRISDYDHMMEYSLGLRYYFL